VRKKFDSGKKSLDSHITKRIYTAQMTRDKEQLNILI